MEVTEAGEKQLGIETPGNYPEGSHGTAWVVVSGEEKKDE